MARIKGYTIKHGKVIKHLPRKSASEKIRQRKSKRQRVVRRTPGGPHAI